MEDTIGERAAMIAAAHVKAFAQQIIQCALTPGKIWQRK
jgi:hypothetical protein